MPIARGLRDGLRADLRNDISGDLTTLETRLRRRYHHQIAGFDALVTRRIGEATPGLRDGILAESRAAQLAASDALRREIGATTDARLEAQNVQLNRRLDDRQAASDARVGAEVAAVVERGLASRLATVQTSIEALGARLARSETGLAAPIDCWPRHRSRGRRWRRIPGRSSASCATRCCAA